MGSIDLGQKFSRQVKVDRFAELYDQEKDLDKRNNIAKLYPQKMKALTEVLDAHFKKIEAEVRPAGFVANPKPLLADSKGLPTLVEYRNK